MLKNGKVNKLLVPCPRYVVFCQLTLPSSLLTYSMSAFLVPIASSQNANHWHDRWVINLCYQHLRLSIPYALGYHFCQMNLQLQTKNMLHYRLNVDIYTYEVLSMLMCTPLHFLHLLWLECKKFFILWLILRSCFQSKEHKKCGKSHLSSKPFEVLSQSFWQFGVFKNGSFKVWNIASDVSAKILLVVAFPIR